MSFWCVLLLSGPGTWLAGLRGGMLWDGVLQHSSPRAAPRLPHGTLWQNARGPLLPSCPHCPRASIEGPAQALLGAACSRFFTKGVDCLPWCPAVGLARPSSAPAASCPYAWGPGSPACGRPAVLDLFPLPDTFSRAQGLLGLRATLVSSRFPARDSWTKCSLRPTWVSTPALSPFPLWRPCKGQSLCTDREGE